MITSREIGSDFHECCQKKSTNNYLNINGIKNQKEYELFVSGRSAIRSLSKKIHATNKVVLMPAYLCESMFIPFEKEGWKIVFYGINIDFTIDVEDVISKVSENKPTVFFLMSYFGFDNITKAENLITNLKNENIIIIEDISHSMYSQFKKSAADFYVASLRKWAGIPEGGIVLFGESKVEIQKISSDNLITKTMLEAFNLKSKYLVSYNNDDKLAMRSMFSNGKDLIAKYDDVYEMSEYAKRVFYDLDCELIKNKRIENYLELKIGLEKVEWLSFVFNDLPKGVIPLYFPVYIRNAKKRADIQKALAKEEIYCPIVWPQAIKENMLNKQTSYIYNHILCIPCDQRYDKKDMKRIVEQVKKVVYLNEIPDIYYLKEWGKLNQEHDGGEYKVFKYECEYGSIFYPMVLRKTPKLIDGIQYYDTITPYGFNGPTITSVVDKEKLLENYKQALDSFCKQNYIIAEYIRFSPWLKNMDDMRNLYTIKENNVTFYIDLIDDFFNLEFSSKCRNIIRKAIKNNIIIEFDFEKKGINDFKKLYNMMTVKNNVNSFYAFDDNYIENLLNQMKNNTFLVHAKLGDKYISSSIFIFNEQYIHYHLSGNDYEYTSYGANSLLLYQVAEWAKSVNIKEFHLGGASHKSLFDFKKQFTKKGILPFYVGYRKSDTMIYDKMCELAGTNDTYFPAYR